MVVKFVKTNVANFETTTLDHLFLCVVVVVVVSSSFLFWAHTAISRHRSSLPTSLFRTQFLLSRAPTKRVRVFFSSLGKKEVRNNSSINNKNKQGVEAWRIQRQRGEYTQNTVTYTRLKSRCSAEQT